MRDILALLDQDAVGEMEEYNQPTDLIAAERLVAVVREATQGVERIKQIVDFVQKRAEYLIGQENRKIANATRALEPFVKGIVVENQKVNPKAKKSVDFITGSAGFRVSSHVELGEDAKVLDACHKNGIETIIKETPSKDAIKKYIEGGGEIEGARIVEEENFTVKV